MVILEGLLMRRAIGAVVVVFLLLCAPALAQLGDVDVGAQQRALIRGTQAVVNAPSGFAGNLADFQVNGTSRLSISNNGSFQASATGQNASTVSATLGSNPGSQDAGQILTMNNASIGGDTRVIALGQQASSVAFVRALMPLVVGQGANVMFNTNTMFLRSDGSIQWESTTDVTQSGNADTKLTRKAAANLQFGAADAASPVAQTLSAQSVAAGTANTSGANWTDTLSLSTGTGTQGNRVFQSGFTGLSTNSTVTISNASPAVITWASHGLVPGQVIQFTTTGSLPTGLSVGTNYYVLAAGLAAGSFEVSATNGGAAINTSSAGSGTHTATTQTSQQNASSAVVTLGPSALTGSLTSPALQVNQVWNTSGNVDAALLINVTNIASGSSSFLADFQIGGTSQFAFVPSAAAQFTPSSGSNQMTFQAGNGNGIINSGNSNANQFIIMSRGTGASGSYVEIGAQDGATYGYGFRVSRTSITVNQPMTSGSSFNFSGPSQVITWNSDTGISRDAAGVIDVGNGTTGNKSGSINLTGLTATGTVSTSSTTDATSTSTGAMQNTGGMSVNKRVWMNGLTTSAGTQSAVLCQSAGGEVIADSVACIASSREYKDIIGPMEDGAIAKISALPIMRWRYKAVHSDAKLFASDEWTRERIGPIAEDVTAVDPRITAGRDRYSTEELLALAIKAMQEQQIEIEDLKRRVR